MIEEIKINFKITNKTHSINFQINTNLNSLRLTLLNNKSNRKYIPKGVNE